MIILVLVWRKSIHFHEDVLKNDFRIFISSDLDLCSPVRPTLVQCYVSTKLEFSTAFLFQGNQRHGRTGCNCNGYAWTPQEWQDAVKNHRTPEKYQKEQIFMLKEIVAHQTDRQSHAIRQYVRETVILHTGNLHGMHTVHRTAAYWTNILAIVHCRMLQMMSC